MKQTQTPPAKKPAAPAKVIDFNAMTSPKQIEKKKKDEYQRANPGAPSFGKF